ncbi:hypothetical protein C8J57DRAFT_1707280 [Mycena rebaudengoi]|nr:hypothetical protein C8J57DRAFT_1707280 [Mycena rebaudengoi]
MASVASVAGVAVATAFVLEDADPHAHDLHLPPLMSVYGLRLRRATPPPSAMPRRRGGHDYARGELVRPPQPLRPSTFWHRVHCSGATTASHLIRCRPAVRRAARIENYPSLTYYVWGQFFQVSPTVTRCTNDPACEAIFGPVRWKSNINSEARAVIAEGMSTRPNLRSFFTRRGPDSEHIICGFDTPGATGWFIDAWMAQRSGKWAAVIARPNA